MTIINSLCYSERYSFETNIKLIIGNPTRFFPQISTVLPINLKLHKIISVYKQTETRSIIGTV